MISLKISVRLVSSLDSLLVSLTLCAYVSVSVCVCVYESVCTVYRCVPSIRVCTLCVDVHCN